MNIKDYETLVIRKVAEKDLLNQQLEQEQAKLTLIDTSYNDLIEVRVIIQEVAKQTQKQLEFHISDIVTLALDTIFPDIYTLCLDFENKRGRTEAIITVEKDGEKMKPMDDNGGGLVDIIAFALRISLWSLKPVKTKATILLDEPFRFLSRGLQSRASQLLSELSKKLNLQFIIVTHEQTLIEGADNIIEIDIKDGISFIKK